MYKRIFLLVGLLLVAIFELRQIFTATPRQTEIFKEATSTAHITAGEIATVAKVLDGDTIELTDGRRVRYIGIDAPEYDECYGNEAKEENINKVNGKTVRLERDVSETDSYGRLLRYVFVSDMLINEQLVGGGFARAWSVPPDEKYKDQFMISQQRAKQSSLGLWMFCNKNRSDN